MPAPPPESEPAIVSTLGMDFVAAIGRSDDQIRARAIVARNDVLASRGSAALQIAETTARPAGFARITSAALCAWIPPIATVGKRVAAHIAARPSMPQGVEASV